MFSSSNLLFINLSVFFALIAAIVNIYGRRDLAFLVLGLAVVFYIADLFTRFKK